MEKKGLKSIVIICIWMLIFNFACSDKKEDVQEKDSESKNEETAEAKTQTIAVFGVVKNLKVHNIALSFTSKLEKIYVRIGQQISRGDRLALLDLQDIEAQIQKMDFDYQTAKMELTALEQSVSYDNGDTDLRYKSINNSIDIAKIELAHLREQLEVLEDYRRNNSDPEIKKKNYDIMTAKMDLAKAEADYEAARQSYDESYLSEAELEDSESAYKQKEIYYNKLLLEKESLIAEKQKELEQLKLSLRKKESDLSELQLRLESLYTPELISINQKKNEVFFLESALNRLKQKLSTSYLRNSELIAPINKGIVKEIYFEEGEYISTNQIIISLYDQESLFIEAYVPEEFIKDIALSAQAVIIPVADPERRYTGGINFIAKAGIMRNNETVVPVQIRLENDDGFLLPNFNVDIYIIIEQ